MRSWCWQHCGAVRDQQDPSCTPAFDYSLRWVYPCTSTISVHFLFFFEHFYFPASGQAMVTGVVPSPSRFLPSIIIAHWVQQSHCSSIFHRVWLTHALALSASQFVRKKKSPRIYTSMHSAGFALTRLTYTRREDNLIRHGATGYVHHQV